LRTRQTFIGSPVCNIVNTANTYNTTMAATKRIPVSEGVWAAISELKHPGQTFDDLLSRMVEQEKKRRFIEDMDRIEAAARPLRVSKASARRAGGSSWRS